MTHTEYHQIPAPSLGGSGEVVVHGHYGRPVIWFPSEKGSPHDFVNNGILDSVRGAVDDGRIKVFAISSYDHESWSASWKPLSDRAKAHNAFEDWLVWQVAPFIRDHCAGREDIATAGASMGAYHSLLFTLRHPHVFPRAVAFSGNYDPSTWYGWGDEDYFTSPFRFIPGLHGDHLDYLRSKIFITLVVGSGQWEDSTGANPSTHAMAGLLHDKGLPHEFYDWGPQWPHDWPSWRAQAAVYLPALG